MKNYLYGIFAIAFLAFTACTNEELPTPGTGQDTPVEHKSGEILVKFSPYVSEILDKAAAATRSGGPATRSGILSVDEVLDIVGGYQIERVFPVDGRNEERTRESELHLWYVVRFGDDYSAEEVAEKLSALGEVQHVNLNRTIRRAYNAGKKAMPLTREALAAMQRATRAAGDTGYPFNDELLPMQWHLINRGNLFGDKSIVDADVQCEEAWKSSTGDKSIIVAVLDEGVMVEHPDLKNSMWVNEGEVYRSKQDNDGNGYKGDVYGYNFVFETGVISWDDINDTGHGTHVAGVIAAQNNNGIGISSIAGGNGDIPGVKIMSCQIFSGNTVSNSLATVRAIKYAADHGNDIVFLDTAGRLHIDEALMDELKAVKAAVKPNEILLVVDAMTGQDAVNAATAFDQALGIDGVMLTKLDGDARGGAALSIRAATGKPIKFVGTGEKLDMIELFHPDRMASRILGMGDMLTFIEKAEQQYDEEQAKKLEEKLRKNRLTLSDYLDQLEQLQNMGDLSQIADMLPGGMAKGFDPSQIDEKQMAHNKAIIRSMTPRERENPQILNASRKKRIAAGCGLEVVDVNRLLKSFEMLQQMTKAMTKGKFRGLGGMMGGMPNMNRMHGFGRKKRLK